MIVEAEIVGLGKSDVFKQIWDFQAYPGHCDAVQSVDILESSASHVVSSWRVVFRRGILQWTERADVLDDGSRIEFVDIEGDIDEFKGYWEIEEAGNGSRIRFTVDFDIGIPTLAHILDPIAEDTLRENTEAILRGMFESSLTFFDAGVAGDS